MTLKQIWLVRCLTLGVLIMFMIPHGAEAGGELVWSSTSIFGKAADGSYLGPYTNIATSNDGVFGIVGDANFASPSIAVYKRSLDNTTGWTQFLPSPVMALDSTPQITVDTTGVYIAAEGDISLGSQTEVVKMYKLSPVDGSIIAVQQYNPAPALSSQVWAVNVDTSGLYLTTSEYAGGTYAMGFGQQGCIPSVTGSHWIVRKFNKNLSSATPIWTYISPQVSGGNNGDYFVGGVGMNATSLILGGARENIGCTSVSYGTHLESIDKMTGVKNWTLLEPFGTGMVTGVDLNDSNLYTIDSPSGPMYGTAVIQKRSLADGSVTWSNNTFVNYVSSIILDGSSSLYVLYRDTVSMYDKSSIAKINTTNGTNVGTTTIDTGVYPDQSYLVFPFTEKTLKLDSAGSIYLGGSGVSATGTTVTLLKKFNPFGIINQPPVAPIVTGPTTGTINTSYTFTASSTDPDSGDTLRYGFDWNNDGTVDTWVPAAGYVASGQAQSASSSWTTVGTKTFQVLAQDNHGAQSGWTSFTDTITTTPRLLVCPTNSSMNVGNSVNEKAYYWSNLSFAPTCATTGYTDVTSSATWSSTDSTIASVTTSGTRGVVTANKFGTVTISALYSGVTATAGVNVTLPPPIITLTPAATIVRRGSATTVTVDITADYNMSCTLTGVSGSPMNFNHPASITQQITTPYDTGSMYAEHYIAVQCTATDDPAVTGTAQTKISVLPTLYEL